MADPFFTCLTPNFFNTLVRSVRSCYMYTVKGDPTIDIKPLLTLNLLKNIVTKASAIMKQEPNVLRINTGPAPAGSVEFRRKDWQFSVSCPDRAAIPRVCVVGDIHGNFEALLHILLSTRAFILNDKGDITAFGFDPSATNSITAQHCKESSNMILLFLGDYVDRGSFSCEVISLIICLKILFPRNIYMLRGNHETIEVSKNNTFFKELYCMYDRGYSCKLYQRFYNLFRELPICAVINDYAFCVHGSLYSSTASIAEIEDLDRCREPTNVKGRNLSLADLDILQSLLWSDSADVASDDPDEYEVFPNMQRMTGVVSNTNVHAAFLRKERLSLVLRAHSTIESGTEVSCNGYCRTIFSCPRYSEGNLGAFCYLVRCAPEDIPPDYKHVGFSNRSTLCAVIENRFDIDIPHAEMRFQPFIVAQSTGAIPIPAGSSYDYVLIPDFCYFDPPMPANNWLDQYDSFKRLGLIVPSEVDGKVVQYEPLNLKPHSSENPLEPHQNAMSICNNACFYRLNGAECGIFIAYIPNVPLFVKLLSEVAIALVLPFAVVLAVFVENLQWIRSPDGKPFNFQPEYGCIMINGCKTAIPATLSEPVFGSNFLRKLIDISHTLPDAGISIAISLGQELQNCPFLCRMLDRINSNDGGKDAGTQPVPDYFDRLLSYACGIAFNK